MCGIYAGEDISDIERFIIFTFLIACVVAMWLICNEIISILENIQDMGVNIPAFLQPLVKHIRSQVEEQININIDKKEDKNSEDE